MHGHGSLLALFLFPQMYEAAGDRSRFVDCHTQYGMETVKGHSFFVARNAHEGFDRISGWIIITSATERKERWNEK